MPTLQFIPRNLLTEDGQLLSSWDPEGNATGGTASFDSGSAASGTSPNQLVTLSKATRTSVPRSKRSFEDRLKDLRAYKEKFGHVNVSTKDDRSLAQYCRNIKHARKNPGRGMKLTNERIASLDALGFDWAPKRGDYKPQKSFSERVQDLIAYKEKHGHLDVKHSDNKSLHAFCSKVRQGRKTTGNGMKLNERRIASLDAIGFDWRLEDDNAFCAPSLAKGGLNQQLTGNTPGASQPVALAGPTVAKAEPTQDSTMEVPDEKQYDVFTDVQLPFHRKVPELLPESVGVDLSNDHGQRQSYVEKLELLPETIGKHEHGHQQAHGETLDVLPESTCPDDSKVLHQELKSVPKGEEEGEGKQQLFQLANQGKEADSSKLKRRERGKYKTFSDRLADLKAFKSIHGHVNVSSDQDKRLAQFCSNARHSRRNMGKSGLMKLNEARIAALDAIGFDWKTLNVKYKSEAQETFSNPPSDESFRGGSESFSDSSEVETVQGTVDGSFRFSDERPAQGSASPMELPALAMGTSEDTQPFMCV